jgi:putative transposase
MSMGQPLPAVELTAKERQQLAGFAASRSLPHALVARARLVLWAAEGIANQEIAVRLGWSKATVGKWRQRFVERRLIGVYDELRPGRPRSVSDEQIAVLLRRTLKQKPPAGTHWTVRLAAEANGLSKSSVHRAFQLFALATAPQQELQAFQRPVLRGKSARRGGALSEPARSCHRAVG